MSTTRNPNLFNVCFAPVTFFILFFCHSKKKDQFRIQGWSKMRVWTLSASSIVRRIAKVFLSFNLTLCTLILLLSAFSSNPLFFFFLCDSNTPATASSVWVLICCWWLAQDPVGSIFFQLVRLNFRGCDDNWSNLLMHVLRHSPVLQTLNFVVLDYGLVYFQSLPKRVNNYMSALRISLMHCISTSSFITEQLESWARCQGSLDSAELNVCCSISKPLSGKSTMEQKMRKKGQFIYWRTRGD